MKELEVVHPEWLEMCKTDVRYIKTSPPFEVHMARAEFAALEKALQYLQDISNIDRPTMMRVDCVQHGTGFQLLEVNSNYPGGLIYTYAALRAYGCHREADRIADACRRTFGTDILVLYDGNENTTYRHKIPIYERIFDSVYTFDMNDPIQQREWHKYRGDRKVVRTCDGAYVPTECDSMVNPLNAWKMGNKSLLVPLSSWFPFVPKTWNRRVEVPTEVQPGAVYKKLHSARGEGVYFPGDLISEPGEYILQERIPIPQTSVEGCSVKWGVDLFFLGEEVFAFSRTCRMDKHLLNITSGGGLMPGIFHVN